MKKKILYGLSILSLGALASTISVTALNNEIFNSDNKGQLTVNLDNYGTMKLTQSINADGSITVNVTVNPVESAQFITHYISWKDSTISDDVNQFVSVEKKENSFIIKKIKDFKNTIILSVDSTFGDVHASCEINDLGNVDESFIDSLSEDYIISKLDTYYSTYHNVNAEIFGYVLEGCTCKAGSCDNAIISSVDRKTLTFCEGHSEDEYQFNESLHDHFYDLDVDNNGSDPQITFNCMVTYNETSKKSSVYFSGIAERTIFSTYCKWYLSKFRPSSITVDNNNIVF